MSPPSGLAAPGAPRQLQRSRCAAATPLPPRSCGPGPASSTGCGRLAPVPAPGRG